MKWMFGKTTMWIIVTVGVAAVAFATTQDPQLPEGDGKKSYRPPARLAMVWRAL